MPRRSLLDPQPRQQAELDRLLGQAERPGDHRLAGDDGRSGGEQDHRQAHRFGDHLEEPVLVGEGYAARGIGIERGDRESPLAQIIERERGKHQQGPAQADRLFAEMAHIRGQRLGPGHGQEHRAQHEQPEHAVARDEADRVPRQESGEDAGSVGNVQRAQGTDREEPDDADRAEQSGDDRGPARLDCEQRDQQDEGDPDHPRLGDRSRHSWQGLEPFDRGQHRQCRGEHRVAVKQRRPQRTQRQDHARSAAHRTLGQREQRQHPALAVVVGAHQHDDVLDGDDQDQRPQHQAHHPDDFLAHQPVGRRLAQRLAKRVERTGPDIAEDDPDRADGQGDQALAGSMAGRRIGLIGRRRGCAIGHRKPPAPCAGGARNVRLLCRKHNASG